MKQYRVIKACVYKGTPQPVGTVLDLEPEVAKSLLAIGRVEPCEDSKPATNRAVGLETSSEQPKKRAAKKKVKRAG